MADVTGNRRSRRAAAKAETRAGPGRRRDLAGRRTLARAMRSDLVIPRDPDEVAVMATREEGVGRTPAGLIVPTGSLVEVARGR